MAEKHGVTPEGIKYQYSVCGKCGEEIVDMKQLHAVAEKYRTMKRYNAKLSRWGESIALRIPKELLKAHHLRADAKVSLIPEKGAIRIVA